MQTTTTYPTQPGQTVYVHQPAPVANYTTTVQNPNSAPSGTSPKFNGAAGRATGILQLCLGIASIIIAIAQFVLVTGVGYVAYGIWGSVLFYIPTGILGICSKNKNTCVIIAYLTMSIITANVAFGQLVTGAVGAGIISNFIYCDYSYFNYWYCEPGAREGRIASDALLSIIGLVEMIVAIVGSAYCCGGMACGGGSSSTRTTTTVYTQQSTPMVVTTGQYGQPQQGPVQPPPAYNVQQTYPPPAQYNQQVVAPAPGTAYPPAPHGAGAQGKDNSVFVS